MSAARDTSELILKAIDWEVMIDAIIAKVKTDHPDEVRILETEKRELETLANELAKATAENVVAHLEQRLERIEHRVAEVLRHIEGQTGKPRHSTTSATTSA